MTYEEYLKEIEDFDDLSKQELLANFKNHIPLDNPGMMQQMGYGSFQDFIKVKNDAQNMQLGETIRGMRNVSPLAAYKFYDQTSNNIASKYFVDGKIVQKGNTSIIEDINKNGYTFNVYNYYFDNNHNGIYGDGQDVLAFRLLLFVSTDGNKVKECYEVVKPADDEVILFLESDEDILTEAVLYGRMSEKVRQQFTDEKGNLKSNLFNNEIMKAVNKYASINQDVVEELMKKGYIENSKIAEGFFIFFKYVMMGVSAPAKALGWVCKKIGDGLDYLKISDDFWDTQSEDYFFDKDNIIKKITISEDLINDIDKLFENRKGLDLHDITPNILEKYIKEYSAAIKNFIRDYNDFVTQEIETFYQLGNNTVVDLMAGATQMWVAYRCGLWNGIVDFVSSLLKFAGELLEAPFNGAQDFRAAMETLDNIYDFLFGGHFKENLKAAVEEMYNKLLDFCKTHNKEDYDWVRVSYVVGNGVAFIASFFIPFTQVLKAAKLGKIAEIIGAVNKEVGAALSATAKYGKNQGYKAISALLELFSKGGKAFGDFLKKVWDELEKWFLSARYKLSKAKEFLGLGFSKETSEILGNLGLKPKLDGFRQTGAGMNLPYGNFITRLEYKGFTVFRGSKKEVATFARELEEMGEEAAIKYLDELLGKSLDDYINSQGFKFLKLGYKFSHSFSIKNGVKDITHYLVNESGEKLWQGISIIEKGVLENVFEVSIQGQDVSTAMYKLLDKIGFEKIIGSYYGGGTLNTNYKVFIEVYEETADKILSAKSTPAGKALIKALGKDVEPTNIVIDKTNKKVIVEWLIK
ncbi:MAG: hypothetical protein LBE92_01155 [Chryseobacterium sp.]|uniref:hypothetical protein n=1 Tax=Chryseobacterium sp. TaxID=1871047 RepID=UPI00282C767F|nr:hypothetical protein [Chryseobacterium sp.]MDR2234706.1 hypothetical protein [Chryseobacterium sp.]